jgi:hypothetical protein
MRSLDPRAWNLCASVAVVVACGPSKIGSSGSEQATDPGETDTAEPECVDNQDCPNYYNCYDGVCKYVPFDDGWLDEYGDEGGTDCYSDADCPTYSYCAAVDCIPMDPPSPECGLPSPAVIPLDLIGGPALALQFVDADADGQDELAIVTESAIELFDNAVDAPTVSPRGLESATVDSVVAGELDPAPGEDLLLLLSAGEWNAALWRHDSNGAGFGPAVSGMSWLEGARGVIAGNFDQSPSSELLVWSDGGAIIQRADAMPLLFTELPTTAATALEQAGLIGNVMLRAGDGRKLFDLGGAITSEHGDNVLGPYGSFTTVSAGYHVAITGNSPNWRGLVIYESVGGDELHRWALRFAPVGVAAGDLDGNGNQELVFWSAHGEVGIEMALLGPNRCWREVSPGGASTDGEVAVGDFDGDGDDELAILIGGQVGLVAID